MSVITTREPMGGPRRVTLMDALQADCPYIPQWLRELAQDHKSTWKAGSCGGWPNYREG